MKAVLTFLLMILLTGCDNFGPEKDFALDAGSKYLFEEGTVLRYSSGTAEEKFVVQKIVNGVFEDSQSGTCGKPRFLNYEYQAVYLKSIDSLDHDFWYLPERQDDCSPSFFPTNELISSLNIAELESYNRVTWMTEYTMKMDHVDPTPTIMLNSREFNNVFEFDVTSGQRLRKLYYTKKNGFVGFELKDGALFTLMP